ncbi:glutathionylspermidine synthase family protein [Streptomyces sp. NPDC048718]|uniref:glutathionylspermidine synthase family protein n=1 Tax=Streptomyces sp. NPDC048718 TaxID=3365587 RepID=UPI0037243F74
MTAPALPSPVRGALTGRYLGSAAGRSALWPENPDQHRLHAVREGLEDRFLTRPFFLQKEEVDLLERDLNGVVDLLFSLPERLFDGDPHAFASAVGLRPEQARIALRPPVREPGRIGRADLYHDGTGFRLLEFNLSSALGGLETAELNRLLLEDPKLADFATEEGLAFPDSLGAVARLIRETADNAGHDGGTLRVALMDWHTGYPKTEPEIRVLARLLGEHGIEAVPCHTGQVREADGRILADGRPVDLVYRFFTLGELTADSASSARADELLDAFTRCDVPVLSPLSTSLYSNKRALAMLWDDRCLSTYDATERALVERLLPWTRELRPGPALVRGERTDLIAYCERNRSRLVLKPSHGLGGVGTVLGRGVSDGEWSDALNRASEGRYIVQELVTPQPEYCPDPETNGLSPWIVNWGAFLVGRRYAGAFLRGLPADRADVISYDNKAHAGCAFQATGA